MTTAQLNQHRRSEANFLRDDFTVLQADGRDRYVFRLERNHADDLNTAIFVWIIVRKLKYFTVSTILS